MAKRICTITDCGKPHEARGFCPMHYRRLKLYGDPLLTKPRELPTQCTLADCGRRYYADGLCELHYARRRRHGGLNDKRAERADPVARFWSKVVKADGCWLWQGPPNGSGYGSINLTQRTIGAHVAAVLIDGRQIPPGMEVDHICRTPMCVRPDHLEVVTHAENLRRIKQRTS